MIGGCKQLVLSGSANASAGCRKRYAVCNCSNMETVTVAVTASALGDLLCRLGQEAQQILGAHRVMDEDYCVNRWLCSQKVERFARLVDAVKQL